MKKKYTALLNFAALFLILLLATSAFGQSITHREGDFIDQYKIDDVGNPYHNHIFYYSHQVAEIVIQKSSVLYATESESLLCWSDNEETLCPDDVISTDPIVYRMPGIMALETIMMESGVTMGAPLTELQEKAIYLAFWHEYKMKKVATDSIAEMEVEEMNALQQRRALKYIYFGHGIDMTTAQSIANARITNSIVATYDDYNLATVPLQDRRLLKLFGEVGWFDEPAE